MWDADADGPAVGEDDLDALGHAQRKPDDQRKSR
jgi:hypothetical protein